jgi:hypothetical protein
MYHQEGAEEEQIPIPIPIPIFNNDPKRPVIIQQPYYPVN